MITLSISFAAPARAAELYFEAPRQTVGVSTPFEVVVLVDAERPVNAFAVSLRLPDGLEFAGSSDGNSIINFWIEKPSFNKDERVVTFAGIVPGGFSGLEGRLTTLTLRALKAGTFDLTSDQRVTKFILNNPAQTVDEIVFRSIAIVADPSKQPIANEIPDAESPEAFAPVIATSSALFGGRYALHFETQDKGSGISGYEIAETSRLTRDYDSLPWKSAKSPYVLRDQSLSGYVFVKAVDSKGNWRVEVVLPSRGATWSQGSGSGILMLIGLALIVWLIYFIKTKRTV